MRLPLAALVLVSVVLWGAADPVPLLPEPEPAEEEFRLTDEPDLPEPEEFWGHEAAPTCLAVVPGTGLVLSGDAAGGLLLWDPSTAIILKFLEGHTGAVTDAAVSPDGLRAVAVAANGTARAWNLETGEPAPVVAALQAALADAASHGGATALSPDGAVRVVGTAIGAIKRWATADGTQLGRLAEHTGPITALAFAPDGSLLASAAGPPDNTVMVWNPETGTALDRYIDETIGTPNDVVFLDGRTVLIACSDGAVRRWELGWVEGS
ncbi:MAG TPA: hypothetical protein VEI97_07720 [bacterium]|nr:hypothetical protein [bacterium]